MKDLRFKTNIGEVKQLYEYSKNKRYKSGILRGLVALQRHYLLESNYILSLNYGHQAEELALKLKIILYLLQPICIKVMHLQSLE